MHHMCRTRPGGPRDRGRTLMLSMRRDWQLNRHRSACARLLGGAGGWREVSAAARRRESSNTTHHAHRRGPLAVAIAGFPFGRGPLGGGGECGGRQCSADTAHGHLCGVRLYTAAGRCEWTLPVCCKCTSPRESFGAIGWACKLVRHNSSAFTLESHSSVGLRHHV